MFLKLFSRYAERAHRGATVASDHLRGTAVVVRMPQSRSRDTMGPALFALAGRGVRSSLPRPWWFRSVLIVHYVFGYRCAQVSLTERYEAVETLSTYGRTNLSGYASDSDCSLEGGGASHLNLSRAHVSALGE